MKLQLKKSIDILVGRPVLFILGQASRIASLLGAKKRRKHSFRNGDTILIMKFQGLGSLALAKPGLHLLKYKYPDSKIYFWGTPSTVCMADLMPEFKESFCLNDRTLASSLVTLVNNIMNIWRVRPKWVFDLEVYSKLSSALATMTLAPNRAGFAIDVVGSRKYTHTQLLLFNRYQWLGTAYCKLLCLIDDLQVAEQFADFGKWNFDFKIPSKVLGKKYAVINPHTGDLALERQWSVENFKMLIGLIKEWDPELQIVLIGKGKDEVNRSKLISESFSSNVISLAEELSLSETMSLLSSAVFVVSNDSGPMHLAIAVSAPTVGLFGPTRPESYMIETPSQRFITKSLYCSPCVHHWEPAPCGGDNVCMQRILPIEVLQVIKNLDISRINKPKSIKDLLIVNTSSYYEGLVLQR